MGSNTYTVFREENLEPGIYIPSQTVPARRGGSSGKHSLVNKKLGGVSHVIFPWVHWHKDDLKFSKSEAVNIMKSRSTDLTSSGGSQELKEIGKNEVRSFMNAEGSDVIHERQGEANGRDLKQQMWNLSVKRPTPS